MGGTLARKKTTGAKKANKVSNRGRATTRSTGGPGYQFEDLVAALLMVKILLGRPLPGVGTGAPTLQFQAEAAGWRIDDLLVTEPDPLGSRHLAISCKSNLQVTASGLPSDFVKRAWAQWRDSDGPMNRQGDMLALVTRGRSNTFDPPWADIVQWCGAGEDKIALARVNDSAKHKVIFESISRPEGSRTASDEETVEFIRHLAVEPHDFQLEPSRDLDAGIEWCRDLVASGSRGDAGALWAKLVQFAYEARGVGGTIHIESLWGELRKEFALRARPDFRPSWESLAALTTEYKAGIATALTSGHVLARPELHTALASAIRDQAVTLVFGESGTGKSALVKSVLDGLKANQVWLGPEQFAAASSHVERSKVQLSYPLPEVLKATAYAENVLVIDAVEKLDADALARVRAVIDQLVGTSGEPVESGWKIVVVSQADGWMDRAMSVAGSQATKPLEVGPVSDTEIQLALLTTKNLRWLADSEQSVAALRNLRTLGWVVQAEASLIFANADLTSPPAIADRIWEHWTGNRTDAQRLLMRLAEREANFERSFPLTSLEAGDVAAFEAAPEQLPLSKNKRNSLTFEHDLAADWARFQRLKEIAHDVELWGPYAQNPLWTSALRMLGQFLLRETSASTTEWDLALAAADKRKDKSTVDILLDALCLDPQADQFLNARADLLLANHGALLGRLLTRFLHVATVPLGQGILAPEDASMSLYLEAGWRSPVVGRWPPVARFLRTHLKRIAPHMMPVVSKVSEMWLTTMPSHLGTGTTMPFRKEFAEIALAQAKELQVQEEMGVHIIGDGWEPLYSAALAAVKDLPQEGSAWALEMVRRRPLSGEMAGRMAEARRLREEERARRLAGAPRRRSEGVFIDGSHDLPPWPLGPNGKVDYRFRKVALGPLALTPLMRLDPKTAREVLLALLIEGNPREENHSSSLRDKVGLEFDEKSYPTAFWKSAFFQFFQIAPDEALTTLIQLVGFCTDRWIAERTKQGEVVPPGIELKMPAGQKFYAGNCQVFDWTQASDHGTGQLHCALDALERWLTSLLEAGLDIDHFLERLLEEGNSLAILGLLTNVAKFAPPLLEGPLRPLLTAEGVYQCDQVRPRDYHFVAWAWIREGELIFERAKAWILAPHRQLQFHEVAIPLIRKSPVLAAFVQEATADWPKYDDLKEAIELDILRASLNPSNYQLLADPNTGSAVEVLVLPAKLQESIADFEARAAPLRRDLLLPMRLEKALGSNIPLSSSDAEWLAEILTEKADSAPRNDIADSNRHAIAATLIAHGSAWLAEHAEIDQLARSVLQESLESISDTGTGVRALRIGNRNDLKFTAAAMMHLWIREGETGTWDEPLLRIMTSGDGSTAAMIGSIGYQHRAALGARWWRLLQFGILWSALIMLNPDYEGDVPAKGRWARWLRWLRSRPLAVMDTKEGAVDPVGIWNRFRRIERLRLRKLHRQRTFELDRPESEWPSHGLATDFHRSLFGWLVGEESDQADTADLDERRAILLRFWDYEHQCAAQGESDREDYRLPYQFGYDVLDRLAWFAAADPSEEANAIWRSVLQLGDEAHVWIERFLSGFLLAHRHAPELFLARWKAMIVFALSEWATAKRPYHRDQLFRRLLGFGFEGTLVGVPNISSHLSEMRGLYRQWVETYLNRDEENVASFCYFLAHDIGAALRFDGIKWIAAALLKTEARTLHRGRRGAGDQLVALLGATLAKNADALAKDPELRTAVVELTADLVSANVTAALALQERLKALK